MRPSGSVYTYPRTLKHTQPEANTVYHLNCPTTRQESGGWAERRQAAGRKTFLTHTLNKVSQEPIELTAEEE